jgi:hypothetical protein
MLAAPLWKSAAVAYLRMPDVFDSCPQALGYVLPASARRAERYSVLAGFA